MHILSHRGFWKSPEEKNTLSSFFRSFEMGFGTETDIRDCDGEIVISHDMALNKDNMLKFTSFLELYKDFSYKNLYIALNVKSDGLQKLVKYEIDKRGIENYRLFDMSIPDMKLTSESKLNFLTRISDIEPTPLMFNESKGIWLDCFNSNWYDFELIDEYSKQNKEVWIVSPELHKRNHLDLWQHLKAFLNNLSDNVFLCTDHPEEARIFFYG